jgi:transketolase
MTKTEFTRKVFGETLAECGAGDPRIVVLTADVSSSVLTTFFAQKFPERFFNVGIAEAGMVDAAVGLALGGYVPFANTFAGLLTRAAEQIRTCVAYARTNVKLIGSYAGLSDYKDGPTHHSIMDFSMFRAMPHMTVVSPADSMELKKLLPQIAALDGPVYFRVSRTDMQVVFDDKYKPVLGKGSVVREGKDLTILANGHMLVRSIEAVERLRGKGISAGLINIHTIKPLDDDLVRQCAARTGAIVTAEEHLLAGGLGSAVAEVLVRERPVPVEMVGLADTFAETALDHESLLDKYGMSVDDIVKAGVRAAQRKAALTQGTLSPGHQD